jgi:hypothetical protein
MGFLFGGQSQASTRTVASGVAIQSSIYGSVVPVVYGRTRMVGNLAWYGGFQAIAQNSSGSGKGGGGNGGKGGGSGSDYDYKASFIFALAEGTLGGIVTVYNSKSVTAWASSHLSFASGAITQSPWGYLTTFFSGAALSYAGTGYVYAQSYDLGQSAEMPNLSYEVIGLFPNAISGLPDADPRDVVVDVLTNARYGVGFPSARLGDLSVFSSYCRAAGLVVSPLFDTQQDAASQVNQIVQDCNAEFVWSGQALTIVPYGDQNLSANGATYTAPSAPLYSLTDDDFLDTGSGDPVQCSRARPSDRMNSVKIEWLNRANQYNIEVVEAHDLAAIQLYGLRTDQPSQSHWFCNVAAATMSATLQLQRQAVRNVYTFTLGWRYCLLDPMDIVEITDEALGLVQQWVRIVSIAEDDNGNLKVTAEDYLGGTGSAPLYSFQTGSPYVANYNVDPGSVNTPLIFEPPPVLTGGVPQVWVGASGGSNWGGADIWLSTDDATYQRVGRIISPAREGVLTATLAAGSDPDTANTLAIDVSESRAQLLSGTEADADSYQTLCYVAGDSGGYELISYETATFTGSIVSQTYALTYLRRGAYGSAIAAHAAGDQFCRLDNAIVQIDLPTSPVSYVGTTIYLKLTSFNSWGGGEEQLADVDAYSYSPAGTGAFVAPPTGIGISVGYVQQGDGTIQPYMQLAWTASPDPLFDSYELEWSVHAANVWTSVTVSAGTLTYRVIPVPVAVGGAFDARVRAVRRNQGGPFFSAWNEVDNVTTVAKGTASADPSGLAAAPAYQHVSLTWSAAAANDIAYYQIWQGTDSTLADATDIGVAQATNFTAGGLANGTTYYYWIRSINTSGYAGDYIGPVSATTLLVDTMGIVPGAINAAGAVNVPALTYSGSAGWQSVATTSINLNVGAIVMIWCNISQGFSSGPKITGIRLQVDGTVVEQVGPGAVELIERTFTISQTTSLASGVHTFEMDWYAEDSSVVITGGSLLVLGPQR